MQLYVVAIKRKKSALEKFKGLNASFRTGKVRGKIALFFLIILLLFNYSCLHFLPTPAKSTSLPCFYPPPWFCPCVLYSNSCNPLFPLSPLPPPPPALAIVRLFLTSMTLVIFCLLFSPVDYIPVKGQIMQYLSLTAWFISLSIVLPNSIHAGAKRRSSFFLSAA